MTYVGCVLSVVCVPSTTTFVLLCSLALFVPSTTTYAHRIPSTTMSTTNTTSRSPHIVGLVACSACWRITCHSSIDSLIRFNRLRRCMFLLMKFVLVMYISCCSVRVFLFCSFESLVHAYAWILYTFTYGKGMLWWYDAMRMLFSWICSYWLCLLLFCVFVCCCSYCFCSSFLFLFFCSVHLRVNFLQLLLLCYCDWFSTIMMICIWYCFLGTLDFYVMLLYICSMFALKRILCNSSHRYSNIVILCHLCIFMFLYMSVLW